ncbi:ribbon-helix-helix protein, CopG family [Candidatus Woesearchaeota archaeon]|nr:ribbon-helix-helix protein, CopG family [Candidatus Woesearchaeota archaeon]
METITLKMEENMVREIDKKLASNRYSTRTEFIRDAIRDKLSDLEKEEALMRLEKLYGASKRNTTDTQLKKAREEAAKDLANELGFKL